MLLPLFNEDYVFNDFSTNHTLSDYKVIRISSKIAKDYICKNHYTHGCHNAPSPCYGLIDGRDLIGVLMFATPCSENVRSSIFGKEYKDSVIELHRLHILDITPKNTESYFISRCLKLLKRDRPEIKAVISFSDESEGHSGIIYKATNFYFLGKTGKSTFYRDKNGRLRHPRQNGHMVSIDDAKKMGWVPEMRESKRRYLKLLPKDKRELKELIKLCKYDLSFKKFN